MDPMERLHIRSSEFESSMKRGLSELREDEEFFDVTLACGSKQVKAHKVILSACSPFFRSLIRSIPHQHPFIYLRGVQFRHLESLLCFMYNGEVSVTYKDLTGLMAVAKELQVIGLIKSVAKPQGKDNTTGVDSTSKQTELNLEGVPGPSAIDEENRKDVTIKKELEDLLSDNEMEDDTMDNEFECSVGTHMLDPPDNEYSGFDDTVPDHIAQGSSGISINDIEATYSRAGPSSYLDCEDSPTGRGGLDETQESKAAACPMRRRMRTFDLEDVASQYSRIKQFVDDGFTLYEALNRVGLGHRQFLRKRGIAEALLVDRQSMESAVNNMNNLRMASLYPIANDICNRNKWRLRQLFREGKILAPKSKY